MALRMAAASRLIGMRRGCRTIRRKKAKPTSTSTAAENRSMVRARTAAAGLPMSSAHEKSGNRPWTKVSSVPRVMTMNPQKMMKWYLLPEGADEPRPALGRNGGFLDDLFLAEEIGEDRGDAIVGAIEALLGAAGQDHPREAPERPREHPEGGGQKRREEDAFHWRVMVTRMRYKRRMALDRELTDILACPKCKGPLDASPR